MKFSCTKDNLLKGLNAVSHISSKQHNLPVLQNVHIKADGGSIVLSTTNLELAIRSTVRGKIDEAGEFTVPAKLLHDFVSLLSGDRVDLEQTGDTLHIQCGETATDMNGMDASEFPLIPGVDTAITLRLPGERVREAVGQVAFAVSLNSARPELAGICVKFGGREAVFAATDSYRLAERTLLLDAPVETHTCILPAQTIQEVQRMVSIFKDDPDGDDVLTLRLSGSQAVFSYGPVELISRTIEGTYPDYVQIIPTAFSTEVVVGRDELAKAVKTASLFSRTGVFDVTIQVQADDKKVLVSATEATRGHNTAACEADVTGKDNGMTVNYRFLLDGLNATGTEGVTLKMIDGMNPCLLVPNGLAEKGGYRYIVMPIRQ